MKHTTLLTALMGAVALGLAGCERQQGTGERVGEEVDEAVDTMKRGEESPATKVDDAIDRAREDVEDAAEDAKN
jgi:predicted small secreted protein